MGCLRDHDARRRPAARTPVPLREKPALFIEGREIAHLEAPGVIDLRITRRGWSQARDEYGDDPAVHRDPARRDWIELLLHSPADLDRLTRLLVIAAAENT